MAFVLKTLGLFIVTAIAEIVGCYLPYLWLKGRVSVLALIPAALSLAAFAWLLSLHPGAPVVHTPPMVVCMSRLRSSGFGSSMDRNLIDGILSESQ
jgi:hypothetical protein